MSAEELSDQFDVLFNNITSNQAPGCTEYEKSVFLTKAQNEIVKNYFTANSKGNNIGQGFDDSAKRQADFSCLMMTKEKTSTAGLPQGTAQIDSRSKVYVFPDDVFIVINESIVLSKPQGRVLQVFPLRYDEYMRLMSKPYKRPLKYQAWRLINQGTYSAVTTTRYAEIIVHPGEENNISKYSIRYIRFPKPIIVGDLDGLSIDGYVFEEGGGDDPTPPTPTPTVITISPSLETALTDIQGQSSAPSDGFGFRVPATLIGGTLSYSGSASTQFTYAEVVRNIDDEEELNLIQTGSIADITSDISHSRDHDILVWIAGATVDGQTLTYTSTPTSSVITSPSSSSSSSSVSSSTKKTSGCELDPILHQDILQRAVELAKVSWTATGQDNAQMVLQAGQRSE